MYISLCLEAFHAFESAPGYRKKKKKPKHLEEIAFITNMLVNL